MTSASIEIDLSGQRLDYFSAMGEVFSYAVSTSRYGAGEKTGSYCTPRGLHRIRAKIGAGQPVNAVFVGRRPTGEVYDAALAERFPDRDWILSRILWLGGCEAGKNRYGDVDSQHRYIYIHGTPDTEPMGKPASIGCIRMRNADVLDLFDRVDAGTPVMIKETS